MRELYKGHRYALRNLKASGETILQFSQDEPLHEKIKGPSCQEVTRALIARVKALNEEEPWVGNADIIHHYEQAIAGFEARALLRKVEKGALVISELPVEIDGHIKVQQ